MAEPSEESKCIQCNKCCWKNINDDAHIKQDFGNNRLEERFKTCVKCRETRKNIISERMKEYHKQYFQEHKEYYQENTRSIVIYNLIKKLMTITNVVQDAIEYLKLIMENTIIVH